VENFRKFQVAAGFFPHIHAYFPPLASPPVSPSPDEALETPFGRSAGEGGYFKRGAPPLLNAPFFFLPYLPALRQDEKVFAGELGLEGVS